VSQTFEEIRQVRGDVINLFRVVANCPPALRPFFALSRFVRDESSLAARLREIAILVTAVTFGVTYQITRHTVAARQAGLTDREISALKAGDWEGFAAAEKAVISYASEVAVRRDVAQETFDVLQAHFSEAQIVELAIIVAWYHLVAAIVQPLRVDLEPELRADLASEGGASAHG
jgi:alkylhydroperoxidase family enzyme